MALPHTVAAEPVSSFTDGPTEEGLLLPPPHPQCHVGVAKGSGSPWFLVHTPFSPALFQPHCQLPWALFFFQPSLVVLPGPQVFTSAPLVEHPALGKYLSRASESSICLGAGEQYFQGEAADLGTDAW
jgi:hypothetical protein